MTDVAEILERAADLIEPEGKWTQGAFSRDAGGNCDDDLVADKPACWCTLGAIAEVAHSKPNVSHAWIGDKVEAHAYKALSALIGEDVPDWNDAPERKQSEVVAKLREAAALARTQREA